MTKHELYVELRDLKQRIAVLLAEVAEDMAQEDRMVDEIMRRVMESDEAQTSMGTCCHSFAPRPEPAPMCAFDDPPSRPA